MKLAKEIYSSNSLTAFDSHTIQIKVTGEFSSIPIPTGTGQNLAGLFTVDLPSTVKTEKEFKIVVRRIATRTVMPLPPIQTPLQTHSMPSTLMFHGDKYISARVNGLGGNAQSIPPSLTGILPVALVPDEPEEFRGKVCEILFDCYGDFTGFVVCGCCGSRKFESRLKNLCEIVLRACREELLVSVYSDPQCKGKVGRLVVRH